MSCVLHALGSFDEEMGECRSQPLKSCCRLVKHCTCMNGIERVVNLRAGPAREFENSRIRRARLLTQRTIAISDSRPRVDKPYNIWLLYFKSSQTRISDSALRFLELGEIAAFN
jgi:hypothetical protein